MRNIKVKVKRDSRAVWGEMPLTPYGEAVKCELARLNMTLSDLAKAVGASPDYISRFLRGRHGRVYGSKYEAGIERVTGVKAVSDDGGTDARG